MAGYDWNKGKSNNAVNAEVEGLVLAGAISKKLKCKAAFIEKNAPSQEWHHVSGWFNHKKYFDEKRVLQWWEKHGKTLWEQEEAIIKEKTETVGQIKTIRFKHWIDKKHRFLCECEAKIVKFGAISEFEIVSDVRKFVYDKKKKALINDGLVYGYPKGEIIRKKIEIT